MPSVGRLLGRLRVRLTVGLFLDIWPGWAGVGLLVAGTVVLVCRMFFPGAALRLPWLWLTPAATAVPALILSLRRAYRPGQVAALADWLGGGQGILLSVLEMNDASWADSALLKKASSFQLPRFQLRRAASVLLPAVAFFAVALMLPQRMPTAGLNPALAEQIAADLKAAVAELKQQALITPAEEQRLEEEIKRIEQGAEKRVDESTWEAADALKEQMVTGLSEKQEAVKWAQESLARLSAAAQGGSGGKADMAAQSAELAKALEKLGLSGIGGKASAELLKALKDGTLSADPATLKELSAALAEQLAQASGKFADVAALGQEFGRFDPSEFGAPGSGASADGDGLPGRGAASRGRGDAELTWGQESPRLNKFKSQTLPTGAARPDDWSPVITVPGAPQENAVLSSQAAARQYADVAGQAAWRRTLAPRHLTAVKKYFDKAPGKDKSKDTDKDK